MSKLLLIATGGTIASRPTPDGVTVVLSGAEVLRTVPRASLDAIGVDVDVVDMAQGASWNLPPVAMLRVVAAAREALDSRGYDGVVITHGTDVLEETAFLAYLLGAGVVVTGAMRNDGETGADGPRNLADAFAVAAAGEAVSRGALVVMNGEVHSARWVTKTDTSSPATFRSPAAMPLGRVDAGGGVTFTVPRAVPPRPPVVELSIEPAVAVVPAHGGVDGGIIAWHLDRGVRGLVVVGTGAGNVNEALVPGVEAAIASGIPVVVASRAPTGAVAPVYGGPGGHASLARAGVIGSGDLGWVKSRIALMVALADNPDPSAVASYFTALTTPSSS